MCRPQTVGELREAGYRCRAVKDELRTNLIAKLRASERLFPGIIGYEDTVIPQLINAILSRHDILLLGLRGQAKTRLLRALPDLLDEYTPALADCELNDDPLNPRLGVAKRVLAEQGDRAKLRWAHRSERYHEKLATPDVTIADLIGEIDLVKHAEGRYLSDEATMHFGLVPRTNRGIFAINELPDLPPRIQVGLFNVLEERDVQIRGYPIRLSLDIMMVFSANPEDYTNRGRIVTPLKDRIGSVVRTHYPSDLEEAIQITEQNAWTQRNGDVSVTAPPFMRQVIEEFGFLARSSPHVNQQSGVSVRASIANCENMLSNAERRSLITGEKSVTCRISDLAYLGASSRGKIELMLAEDETTEEKLIKSLFGEAVKKTFDRYADVSDYDDIVEQFANGLRLEVGDHVPSDVYVKNISHVKGLVKEAKRICARFELDPTDANIASAAELILEALYVSNRLSKYARTTKTFYGR